VLLESKRQRNVAAEVEDGIYKMKKFASVAEKIGSEFTATLQ